MTLIELKKVILERNQLRKKVEAEMREFTMKGELKTYGDMPSYKDYWLAEKAMMDAIAMISEATL